MEDVLNLIDARKPAPKKRGPYKKEIQTETLPEILIEEIQFLGGHDQRHLNI